MTRERTEYDWASAKERLQKANESLDSALLVTGEHAAAILETRARLLAQRHQERETAPRLRALTFRVGSEQYAIDATYVFGVVRLTELTLLPDAPPHVVGITHVRGEILPLFDLRQLLGRGTQALNDLSSILVVGTDQPEFGLVADEASEILELSPDEIHSPSPSVSGADREIVHGVTSNAVTVLAGDTLCRDSRLFITARNRERN